MSIPITFLEPDSETAQERLAQVLQPIPAGVPIVGLVLKVVQRPGGEEELVNYEFADPDLLRSLALVLSLIESAPANPSKES